MFSKLFGYDVNTSKKYTVGIAGMGCVGGSVHKHFTENTNDVKTVGYDKYKDEYKDTFDELLECDYVFYCLPTLYSQSLQQYDKEAIFEVTRMLSEKNYQGMVVVKSTVEPGVCEQLTKEYPNLNIAHNPEFLTARTCFEDFAHQSHIVLGKTESCDLEKFRGLEKFYRLHWPQAEFSVGNTWQTEAMKIFCNSYYSVKIAVFNEMYDLCKKNNQDFEVIKSMMFKNGWINEMHTKVPGPDGKIGYGGMCFPKDSNALNQHMARSGTYHAVMNAACEQNPVMRGSWD